MIGRMRIKVHVEEDGNMIGGEVQVKIGVCQGKRDVKRVYIHLLRRFIGTYAYEIFDTC